MNQAETVARIAVDMGYDGPPFLPEAREVLKALHKAYQAGWQAGFKTANDQNTQLQEVIGKLWSGAAP